MLKVNRKSFFRSSLERESYLELLGAKKTRFESHISDRPVYKYGDLSFTSDSDYSSVYCQPVYAPEVLEYYRLKEYNGNIYYSILQTTEERNLFCGHIEGNHIFTLEGLVYLFAKKFHKNNVEEYYNETLQYLKTQALLGTFATLDKSIFEKFNDNECLRPTLDAFMKVMNMSAEDTIRFSKKFLFNTTGVFEKENSKNMLDFYFYTPSEKYFYEIHSYGNGAWDLYTLVGRDNGYLSLKIRDSKLYVTKMHNYHSNTFDLAEKKVSKSWAVNDPDNPWVEATLEELNYLEETINELNNSVALIDSTLKKRKSNTRTKRPR